MEGETYTLRNDGHGQPEAKRIRRGGQEGNNN